MAILTLLLLIGAFAAIPVLIVLGVKAFTERGDLARERGLSPTPAPIENGASAPLLGSETFIPSQRNTPSIARLSIWIGLGIGILVTVVGSGFRGAFWTVLALSLFLGGFIELIYRKGLKTASRGVTLDDNGFQSENLSGPTKCFAWTELVNVAVVGADNQRALRFHLAPSSGRPDKRAFLTGANPSQPTLVVTHFTPQEQERLVDAILRRKAASAGMNLESLGISNDLAEERRFQEQLTALAPRTWVTWSLVGINIAVWCLTLTQGAGLTGTPADKLLLWGGNAASEVQKGEWWRLLTATFLHNSLMHVVMNMIGLYTAGMIVERIYGARLYLIVYFGAALLGSAFSMHFSAQHAVSVGASGAVFGVTGAWLVAVLQHRNKLPKAYAARLIGGVGFFIVYSLLQGFTKSGIDNAAHVGGLVGGALTALILPERFDLPKFHKVMAQRALAAIAATAAAVVVIVAMAPAAAIDQDRIFASEKAFPKTFADFQRAMRAVQQDQEAIKTGKLSEREVDERTRTVHAPVMRRVRDDLAKIVLRPGDPRAEFVQDLTRLVQLVTEALEMDSIIDPITGKIEPVNPRRAGEIESEILRITKKLEATLGNVKPRGK